MMRKGFTLIELMIVVLVIGILASVGISKYQSFVMESRMKTCMSQLKAIDQAMGVWETKNVGFVYDNAYLTRFNNQTGAVSQRVANIPVWTGISVNGIVPQADDIRRIVNDVRVFACPELVSKFGDTVLPNMTAAQNTDWRLIYGHFKVMPPGPGFSANWKDWVPENVGRATTCFTFGYFNSGNKVGGANWGWVTPPSTGVPIAPGWGDPTHQGGTDRGNLMHLQWGTRN